MSARHASAGVVLHRRIGAVGLIGHVDGGQDRCDLLPQRQELVVPSALRAVELRRRPELLVRKAVETCMGPHGLSVGFLSSAITSCVPQRLVATERKTAVLVPCGLPTPATCGRSALPSLEGLTQP